MIRVLICDDQDLVCEGLRAILEASSEIQVAGVAHDGAEAVELVAKSQPDVVLMDLKMPIMNGLQATQAIRQNHPQVKVLVLTTYDADEWVFDAIRSGAAGYLLKNTPREALVRAIKDTVEGKTPVDSAVAGKLFSRVASNTPAPESSIFNDLSERDLDILRLVARGLSNADIAQRLFLTEGTVRNYVSQVLMKLGVTDRTQAAVIALRHGLVDLNEL
ncbi:MAG: response regulator [Chloroflexota bacterium]|jgi:DNA-binding NarL/FixJ family response regulator